MTDIEVSELLRDMMMNMKSATEELMQSEEFLAIQARKEEISEQSQNELSEKLAEEVEELKKREDELYNKMYSDIFEDISQKQMFELLSNITPELMEENHFSMNYQFFSEVIEQLLERIDDPNCVIHNGLLANEQFMDVIKDSKDCLTRLIENTNDEKSTLEFLIDYFSISASKHKSKNGRRREIGGYFTSTRLLMMQIMNSKNYSLEFKGSLLTNQVLVRYMDARAYESVIFESDLPKSKKMEVLFRSEVMEKLDDDEFSRALGSLCQSYDDYHRFLSDGKILKKINIYYFLKDSILSSEELQKLFFDDLASKDVEPREIAYLLSDIKIDFDTRKRVLFDSRIFPKLDWQNITNIITCKYLTSQQRFELINDKRILDLVDNKKKLEYFLDRILDSYFVPTTDKITMIKDERFMKYLKPHHVTDLIQNESAKVPIEVANDIIFDKRLFYRLIGEYNEEYNPDIFNGDEKPKYRYDKYKYAEALREKNPFVAKTLYYGLLKDEILDLGFDFIEKMSRYPDASALFIQCFKDEDSAIYILNMIRTIESSSYLSKNDVSSYVTRLAKICNESRWWHCDDARIISEIRHNDYLNAENFTEDNWRTITEIALRNTSLYYNEIRPGWITKKVEIDVSLNILPDVETIEDLDNYEVRRRALCDEYFKDAIEQRNLDGLKNAYLNKYFNVNIQEAQEIVRMYGHSIQDFSEDPKYVMQTSYIIQLQKIININKIETISDIYKNSSVEPLAFDETIFIDSSIRQMFSEQMSNSMYKVSDRILNEAGEYVPNVPKDMEFVIDLDGVKTLKKVQVYEPGFDFKMLIHSTAAYGQMELINDNYFDSWNKNESRKSNHGICCSLIANDNMGMAAVNDVLFGFDSWDSKAITKSAPYDIYSKNDDYDIEEGRQLTFMSTEDIINNTRHTHNEHILERYELREDRRTYECQNIQPSYVIIYSDMTDEIKQKAIKCSTDMNIPIVYLDKEKIVQHEVSKIDGKIEALSNSTTFEERIDILEQILLSHENNRSGLKASNGDWIEQYFPTSKIDRLFDAIIMEMQSNYYESGNIADYFKYSSQLIDLLEKENKKFNVTMETVQRKNYIDIPVDAYKTKIMQCINPDLCRNDKPKLETIIQLNQAERPDAALSQALSSVDIMSIHNQVEDIMEKDLYPNNGKNHNIGHIERVMFLSQLIGYQELKLENGDVDEHAVGLLTECAKYHDCGRKSDRIDKKHGQKSAQKMYEYLQQAGFSEEDIRIMQVAVEYHEEVDEDYRFEKICQKYEVDSGKVDYAKKIANCLKDADALDRTRFSNPKAALDVNMLRFKSSKELVPIAKDLNNSYKEYDRKQFARNCEYLYQQSLLQSQTGQGGSIDQLESNSQERKR